MPIYIPDRIKAPGDFPTLDANDNQIRGFGFFDDATERSALKSNLRCQGYLAFMKDTTQFKQYDSASEADVDWENDSNWVLIEGQQTDTYWALDSIGGSAIYYSNPVWIGSSLYAGSEQLYVNGDTKISGALEATTSVKTPIVQSDTSLVIGIDAPNGGVPPSLILEWKYGINRFFSASPYKSPAPDFVFGNQLKNWDFKFQTISANADVVHDVPSGVNPGFQFKGSVDSVDVSGKFVANLTDGSPRFSFENDLRKIIFAPEGYKISTTVDADANVLNGVEILLPDPDTGDMHFKNIAQKNFLFSTNTGSGSPTEILEMKPDLVVSNVNLEVNGSGNFLGNINVGVADSALTGIYLRRTDNALMGGIRTNDNNTVIIGGFNNDRVQIARHVADGTLDDEVMGHFNTTGLGLGTTSPSQKLHVVGSMYLADNTTDGNALIGTGWSTLTGQYNTALGYQALESITTSSSNTAIGYQANQNTTVSQSVAVGYRAARGATGSHTAIGYLAGQTNAGGTYVGYASASGSTVSSTVIGQENYRNVKTGGGDIAIGYLTMYSDKANKVGGSNLMIGNSASYYAGSDTYNTVLGHQALRGTDEGAAAGYLSRDYNVAVGERAMYRAYSGANKNIVIGYQAGYSQQLATDAGDLSTVTFGNNVFIGYQSAYDITNGSRNVAIGEQSAFELTEGENNVILGYKAGLNLTTGDANVLLGYGAGGQLTTESNKLYIANSNTTTPLIYGDFSLGNVGIGETSPDTKLHITGSQVNSKLLTIENIADANWGGGLILKWANADGTNPYSVDIGAYNISGQQMRFKFTGLSERVSFSGAPGYQFDKEVIPGSGAADGGIASQYHSHLYFRLRSNNGNNGHDPTNMYFKAEGGTGTSNISGNLMIMKGDGDIEVPNGDLEISDSSNGLILKDTVTSTRYRVQITSGAIAISAV